MNLKAISKPFSKYTNINNPVPTGSPNVMPAFAHDYGNYVARYGMGNYQIQAVMKLDDRIDFDKLSAAVRLSVDAEPVLGCRFVEHAPPYWKRLKDIDNIMFCSIEETDNTEEAVRMFLESPLDMDLDPMVKVKLIRSEQCDTIGIKLNHTCCDGAGAKEYIHLLSRIYSDTACKNGAYVPEPSIRDDKDHIKVFKNLGIKHPKLDNSVVEAPRTAWPFQWKSAGQKNITPFVVCRLPDRMLDSLSKYGKERGAKINDLIVTAFYRAMFKISRPPYRVPMDIGLTIDLRRYLPDNRASAIRNLSGGIVLRIARLKDEPFDGTLARVVSLMNRKKSKNPGYQCATGAEHAEVLNFYQFLAFAKFISKASDVFLRNCYFCSPGLSNVGIISKTLIKFGDSTVIDAYIIPPVIRMPGIMIVASSYNGKLTFATGYYKGSVRKENLEKLLDGIRRELIEGCK